MEPGMASDRLRLLRRRSALQGPAAIALLLCSLLLWPPDARGQEPLQPGEAYVWLPIARYAQANLSPWPAHDAQGFSPNGWLEWTLDTAGIGAEHLATLRYDVLMGAAGAPRTEVARDLARPLLPLYALRLDTTYAWQVRVRSDLGMELVGPIWRFTTLSAAPPDTDAEVNAMIDIAAGNFQMGCDPAHNGGYACRTREVPLHTVYLDAYRIDKYETTNRQYRACVYAGKCREPRKLSSRGRPDYFYNAQYDFYPVLYVSWWDARDYCEWADKRLPTEAEWEKAARGPIDTRPWPWGEATISCRLANFTDTREAPWLRCTNTSNEGDTTVAGWAPMGASPYGALDMAGNAFEWVWDKYDEAYYRISSGVNPTGPGGSRKPEDGPWFVIRGGSYRPDWFYPRAFNRHWGHHGDVGSEPDWPYYRNDQGGFRCAADAD